MANFTLRQLIGALNEAVRDGAELDGNPVIHFPDDEYIEIKAVRLVVDGDPSEEADILQVGDIILDIA